MIRDAYQRDCVCACGKSKTPYANKCRACFLQSFHQYQHCKIGSCAEPIKALDMCRLHYGRHFEGRDVNAPVIRLARHGLSNSPEFRAWANMKSRCSDVHHKQYPDYGGRGITVCKEWQQSFRRFYEDMGSRPSSDHSLERVNNNAGYFPDNCRWATRTEQSRNRRNNKRINLNGETRPMAEWCDLLKVPYELVMIRIRRGMNPEEAFTRPPRSYPRKEPICWPKL